MHSLKGFEGAEIALRARIRLFGRLSMTGNVPQ